MKVVCFLIFEEQLSVFFFCFRGILAIVPDNGLTVLLDYADCANCVLKIFWYLYVCF